MRKTTKMKKILAVIGTRPEAIKMAPLIQRLRVEASLQTCVCVTGQHRELVDGALAVFGIVPDIDMNLLEVGQTLGRLASRVLERMDALLGEHRPDHLLVHGDTTTAMAAALAGFYRHVRVGHVEAGLRTGDFTQPWPEEMNRRVIDLVGSDYYAPTQTARANLLREGVADENIVVTGNTVIDALLATVRRIDGDTVLRAQLAADCSYLDPHRRLILVTGHRRENQDGGLEQACRALVALAARTDVQIVYAVHPNPAVRTVVRRAFEGAPNVTLIEPLDYLHFVFLMGAAHFIMTDSGGIQEEAPSLGKPVLVLRDVTERPEAVAAGTIKLVGTICETILAECQRLLDEPAYYASFASRANPYGDGRASERIVAHLMGLQISHLECEPSEGNVLAVRRRPIASGVLHHHDALSYRS
jgi:UDP-N-acetylglucosamine 2-epimerase (non-hydrolysing)